MLLAKHEYQLFTERYHALTIKELEVIYCTSEKTINRLAKKLGLYGIKERGRWTCKKGVI